MKKLFIALFVLFVLSFNGFAEIPSFNVKEVMEEYSSLLPQILAENLTVKERKISVPYKTREYTLFYRFSEYGQYVYEGEEHLTNTYNEIQIIIPTGYEFISSIFYDNKMQLRLTSSPKIPIFVNGEDKSFYVEYSIEYLNETDKQKAELAYLSEGVMQIEAPLVLTIKYSPKYFKAIKVDNDQMYKINGEIEDYDYYKDVIVKCQEKNINFRAEVFTPFILRNEADTHTIMFMLEPNFQNIYNDFSFFRKKIEK